MSSPSHQSHLPPPPLLPPCQCTSLGLYKTVLILPGGFEKLHRRGAPWPGTRSERMRRCSLPGREGCCHRCTQSMVSECPPASQTLYQASNLLDPLWGVFPLSLSIFLMNFTVLSSLSLPHHCLNAEAEQPEPIFCMALARQDTSLRFGILFFKMEKACSSYKNHCDNYQINYL